MVDPWISGKRMAMLVVLLGSGILVSPALAQSDKAEPVSAGAQAPAEASGAAAAPSARKASPYHPGSVQNSAKDFYRAVWGIDNLLVRRTASDNLIRFSYRIADPARAKALGDKRATPYLFGQRSRAVLHVPVMDKVGQLRQTGTPEAGKEYWMVFSNKGNLVKAGDRVNVIIGSFHADGLMVE